MEKVTHSLEYIIKNKLPFDKKKYVWIISIQVIEAMIFLYNLKIGYRDVKPSNILLYKNGLVKICDLNVSKILKKDGSLKTYE